MNRRTTITILVCLIGLWSAAASAGKVPAPAPAPAPEPAVPPISVPPPAPEPALPPGILPTEPPKPPPPPAAPPGSPISVPPTKLPLGALPADSTGGSIAERLLQIEEGGLLPGLEGGESGIGKVTGPGPGGDDPLMGEAGIQKEFETAMERFCKTGASNLFPGMCRGRYGDGLPTDGDPSGFYNTENPSDTYTHGPDFQGQRAGSGVPSRDGRAGDDKDFSYTDSDGRTHKVHTYDEESTGSLWIDDDVYNRDGSLAYHNETTLDQRGRDAEGRQVNYIYINTTYANGQTAHDELRCQYGQGCIHRIHIPSSQPGEPGYGQTKARPWFCARNPKAKGCETTTPESQTDPAHPDGEGTAAGRPRAETPRLGRGAVSDPGPGDSEIRGTTGGGGSGPGFDPKDPIGPGEGPSGPGPGH